MLGNFLTSGKADDQGMTPIGVNRIGRSKQGGIDSIFGQGDISQPCVLENGKETATDNIDPT